MKKLSFILLLAFAVSVNGQFKKESGTKIDLKSKMISSPTPSFVLGFINPNNFKMNHSLSMSYSSFGSEGIALGVYRNSLYYKVSDKINLLVETSIVNSPYSSLGGRASQSLNGIYLSRAQLNYKISDNSELSIQFSNDPTRFYSPYSSNPYYGNLFFDNRYSHEPDKK